VLANHTRCINAKTRTGEKLEGAIKHKGAYHTSGGERQPGRCKSAGVEQNRNTLLLTEGRRKRPGGEFWEPKAGEWKKRRETQTSACYEGGKREGGMLKSVRR